MKILLAAAVVAMSLPFGGAVLNVDRAYASAGKWTKCHAESGKTVWYIMNGQSSREACHNLALACTGDSNVTSYYNTSPVYLKAPFNICKK